jgi:tetratricopeptide (TPR) repeat protein
MVDPLRPVPPSLPGGRAAGLLWVSAAALAIVAVAGLAGRFGSPSPALAAPAPHVVVLPCRLVEGSDVDRTYCEGLAATLTARLAQLTVRERLQVTPASDVRASKVATAAAARQQFGAGLAFEGTVFVVGTERRISYALVDTGTASQLDGITYTSRIGDGFASADRIIEWALGALETRLARRLDASPQRATALASAEDFVIQGRGYLLNYQDPANIDNAITVFQHALQLDAAHAPALAGLGGAYWLKFEVTRDPEWTARARASCGQALAANSRLAAAHICLGTVFNGSGEYERAADAFRRALDAEPGADDAYGGLAAALEQLGRSNEAEQTFLRAIELRPYYWGGRAWLGSFYRTRARFDEAIVQYREAVRLSPDNARAHAILGGALAQSGRYAEAIDACRRSIDILPNAAAYGTWGMVLYRERRFSDAIGALEMAHALLPDFRRLGNLARACYWAGDRDRARRLYEDALAAGRRELGVNPRNADVRLSVAEYLAKLNRPAEARAMLRETAMPGPHERHFAAMTLIQAGDSDRALALLREAADAGLPRAELAAWIDLDAVRSDPRFAALTKERMP